MIWIIIYVLIGLGAAMYGYADIETTREGKEKDPVGVLCATIILGLFWPAYFTFLIFLRVGK